MTLFFELFTIKIETYEIYGFMTPPFPLSLSDELCIREYMVKRIFKTVKARILAMMVCFALAITVLVMSFSYFLIYNYQWRTSLQSTEFNLNLVGQTIGRDLIEAFALANWCGQGVNPPARYLASDDDPIQAVESFERLREEYRNNRASRYINRVLIISNDQTQVLHTGGKSSDSTLSFLDENSPSPIKGYELMSGPHIYDITVDPYSRKAVSVINILAPVYAPASTEVLGTVYMAVDTTVVSDNLKGYTLPEGAMLYLTIGDHVYRIDGNDFTAVKSPRAIIQAVAGASSDITANKVETADGESMDAVSCRIRDGVILTQLFDSRRALPPAGSWLFLVFGICLLIVLLSVFVIIYMNRTISIPIARIRHKIDKIAAGDFSADADIESDNEIGEVGRGINKLSREVVGLMENRLADEQQKRELEYRMLQSQINPHFLYNTLGAIKWMATLQKAEGIAEMTTALSRLLKTVSKDLRKVVALRDEIDLLDDYFVILKYRYGSAIVFEKNIDDEDLLGCLIPRFVLQPIMENAISHGIEPKGRGTVKLSVRRRGDDVIVSLWDDGVGIPTDILAGINNHQAETLETRMLSAIGIRSVHDRIRHVFGEKYGLQAESEQGVYTRMTITIPYEQ